MSNLSMASKTYLEGVFGMSNGHVLDFSNASFANFFRDLNIDIYDAEQYPGFGDSKANRMRALWKNGTDAEVSSSLVALGEYVEAKTAVGPWGVDIDDNQVARLREIARGLDGTHGTTGVAEPSAGFPPTFTTEASVTANRIQIEIHEDIYSHIAQYLAGGDFFHAVEESYKLVREKLREKTGSERATDAFAPSNHENIFGHQASTAVEKDFFDGVKYLNMSIQFLRNEKAHTPATPLEPNLAIHYISLASLAYDLITRYVSEATIQEIEELVLEKRRSFRSAGAFYRAFENGKWLDSMSLPKDLESSSVRRILKHKWLDEADFTRSYDYSNVVLMRLELVAEELAAADLNQLLDQPTRDANGRDQAAGMLPFLEFMQQKYPETISPKVERWMSEQTLE
ncbi:TIGR02391 family protein [Agromyces mariniharenae]|uniref:TIGR02391 family protein n=1 Tax=Agromyces mariniharenae TaxID=2604423 RepID=A0A5S4V1U9_9MICO|nr:TIGR02391 family protein [Agromyces mariniharenae]TYL51171.1 TIGR02391 family protein [Agromyces mariniharenae]